MPRGYNNYSLVIDSSFQPFSFQEMLTPFMMYKDAYEKAETDYTSLTDQADKFKYLSETLPEGSKSRQIYEGYANELSKQAADLAQNGLSMGSRRALTNLKRRYQGEIGRLASADAAMDEEKKLRRQLSAKDSSMLYAMDNLSIDDFLDGNTPNLYNISGTELYTRGAAAGKAASSRVYSAGDEGSTLNGYYRKWVERNGYSKESMDAFRANAAAIPELQQAADAILAERGVNENLTGANLERARQSVLNGIIDGAVYAESVKPVEDRGKISAGQAAQITLSREQMTKNAAMHGLTWNNQTRSWDYDPNKDPNISKATTLAEIKAKTPSGGKGSGAAYDSRNKAMTMVGAKTGNVYKEAGTEGKGTELDNLPMRALSANEYSQLVDAHGNITNEYLRSAIGNGQLSDYEIYVIHPDGDNVNLSGTWGYMPWNWGNKDLDEDVYVAIPRDSKRAATEFNIDGGSSSGTYNTNDIPE